MPNGENRDDIIIIPVFLCSGSGSLSILFTATAIVIVFATIPLEHQQKKQYNKDKQN
ncbi:hypothetical protein J28TS4_13470 [Paenibacillus lautus]|nr:hypothetical protein J28TS4_13470 [Paenibacillus lautus]